MNSQLKDTSNSLSSNNAILPLGYKDGHLIVASKLPDFDVLYAVKRGEVYTEFKKTAFSFKESLDHTNLIYNGNFSQNPIGWKPLDPKDKITTGINISSEWVLNDANTAYIQVPPQTNNTVIQYDDPEIGTKIPILPNEPYTFHALFAAHRCNARLEVFAVDKNENRLLEVSEFITDQFFGGSSEENYQKVKLNITPPQGSQALIIRINILSQNVEDNNSAFIFISKVALQQGASGRAHTFIPRHQEVTALLRALLLRDVLDIYCAEIPPNGGGNANTIEVVRLSDIRDRRILRKTKTDQTRVEVLPFDGNSLPLKILGYELGISVLIDGKIERQIPASSNGASERNERIIVAEKFCDGNAHSIEIRDELGITTLARDLQIFPNILTPWNVIQDYSNPPFPSHLSPAAKYRYRALKRQLENLAACVKDNTVDDEAILRISKLPELHQVLENGFQRLNKFPELSFPKVLNPDVSVVIPAHNKFNVTYFCLCALLFAANTTTFEVIVVDDGSEDETLNLPSIAPNVKYCRNEMAQGFVRACNLGASHAKGKYLAFLNNDTEPTADWIDELILAFENFQNVGMAGSKLLYPDGRLQEAGGIVWNNGNPWNYGRLSNPHDPRYSYTRQADYLSGAAVMIPRTVWDQVGGFSDEFAPAYFEDTDLCFKVRAAGYKTLFVPTSIVYHFEGISNGTDVNTTVGLKRYQEINRPKFKRKWIGAVYHNGEEGVQPDLAKDRGIIGRVLFIDYQVPKPDIDAGSYAAIQEMRLVQSLGYKVTFVATNVAYMGHYDEDLNRLGIETIHAPFYLSVNELLEKRGAEFDVVYLTRFYVAQGLIDLIRSYAPQAKILFNNADLHFLRELRTALHSKDSEAMAQAIRIRDEELAVMRRVDAVLSYNDVEHAVIVSHNLDSTKVVKCPWVVETRDETEIPPFESRTGIAFLGGYGHPPNVEAVEFFVREVMPLLRQQIPDVQFNVYGSAATERIKALSSDDINIVGYVDTVDMVYDKNRIFVAPLLTGAGIKGKVLGALAHGIPTVLSPIAAESTGVRDGLDCTVAKNPLQWAQAISYLYTNSSAWEHMSKNAISFTKKFYSFDNGRLLMKDAFESVGIYRTL